MDASREAQQKEFTKTHKEATVWRFEAIPLKRAIIRTEMVHVRSPNSGL